MDMLAMAGNIFKFRKIIMAYYTVCPACGANLDPGEKCDCEHIRARQYEFFKRHLETEQDSGQFAFVFDSISSTGYTNMKC